MYATENHTMCKTFYMRAIGHLSISNLIVYFVLVNLWSDWFPKYN